MTIATALPPLRVHLDEHGSGSLNGTWEFYPGDHERTALPTLRGEPITVPGLWEAQGHLELDGPAWYRLRFVLADAGGWWTLRFAAVMDVAEVWLNGRLLGSHQHPFTPFELAATGHLVAGENILEVRVTDPPVDDPMHLRSAHGKQGWANHIFPSRPSLYMTYGGIWQRVTLRRHGPVQARNVFVNGDPDDLVVTVDVVNISDSPVVARAGVRALHQVAEREVELAPGSTEVLTFGLGASTAARWSPENPARHDALVDLQVDGALADRRRIRFGLRTVRVEGTTLLLNGEPYRMKSVLVQGFRAEELYAEGTRESIVAEVQAAREMGFTMLRLHIKAFDPVYLDVCDELGMLVHCDLPVAEPIAHDELGNGTELTRRCVEAIGEQVRRDRNHPSIVLWSAMNELGYDRRGVRDWDIYEQFARTLFAAVSDLDPTRPVIENDWVEPDPGRVFCSPILTAHWYGRLHADYLHRLERQAVESRDTGKPLYVTEFGDWGLPDMPLLPDAPFWDTHDVYAAGLAQTLWPATIGRFVQETQRYQGLSDRLQIEVFRRHDHIGGYCLTELTDVPHELNGVLDLRRRPKPLAVEEIRRANQAVLPMLHLTNLVVTGGDLLEAPLHIANDGPALDGVTVRLRFGGAIGVADDRLQTRVGWLPAHAVTSGGPVSIRVPQVAGNHDLLVELRVGGRLLSENRYPIHVVTQTSAPYDVSLAGEANDPNDPTARALAQVGARLPKEAEVLVVGEGALDSGTGARARQHLAEGGTVLVLAQEVDAAPHYPVPAKLGAVGTAWGSSVFHFTTDEAALPSLPRRNVLVGEDSTVQARSVVVGVGDQPFPDEPVVIAYKPVPGSLTGTVVGGHQVGPGRLLLCQYRLVHQAVARDPAACALLRDLVAWAAAPRPPTRAERTVKDDGRGLTYYSYGDAQ